MNAPRESPVRQTPEQTGRWLLEIVRGRDVGRTFALGPGETPLGNALNGQKGLDLREQEGSSPRRMAPRHASVECIQEEITIRDLDSPGGTFVNQQRLLSGQARKLRPGDVIQLGGVQLKVKESAAAVMPAAVPASALPAEAGCRPPLRLASGAQCRTWDDFLVLSAQSWAQVRDELVSGRLIDFLRRIGRPDLIPHSAADRSADDRLDEWLARLPATQSSAPELEVHPQTLLVQAKTGGGVARMSLRLMNVGFRLLRSTVRVEPADARWVRLPAVQDGRALQTIDQTEIPVEIELPETIEGLVRALIVVESNGGTRRVEVRIERPAESPLEALPAAGPGASEIPILARALARRLTRVSPVVRAAVGGAGAAGIRLLFAVANALPFGGAGKTLAEPRLSSIALVTVAAGVLLGLKLASRRGERRDSLTAGIAGGLLGLLCSALGFSVLQSIEGLLWNLVDVGRGRLSGVGHSRRVTRCALDDCDSSSPGASIRRAHDGQEHGGRAGCPVSFR